MTNKVFLVDKIIAKMTRELEVKKRKEARERDRQNPVLQAARAAQRRGKARVAARIWRHNTRIKKLQDKLRHYYGLFVYVGQTYSGRIKVSTYKFPGCICRNKGVYLRELEKMKQIKTEHG